MPRILIVEDEKNMAKAIKMELEHAGYETEWCDNGRDALKEALNNTYDMILLDLMIPYINGIEVCRRLRLEKQTPVIMLTARDSVMDKVNGLQIGADDYLAKPFALEELQARMQAIFRRSNQNNLELKYRDLLLDIEGHRLYKGEAEIELTLTEYKLLYMLMKHAKKVLSRDEIINEVWGYENDAETNVVDVYIRYLRNKIEEDGDKYIYTVRGIGYRFE